MKDYKCNCCGQDFQSSWSEEEAWKEFEANGFDENEEICIVCDPCYHMLLGTHNAKH